MTGGRRVCCSGLMRFFFTRFLSRGAGSGNLGGTPELRYLPSGDQVVNFSVAVNRRYKDRDGNPKEVTECYRICAFNGIGIACAQYLEKGDPVFVEGRLQVRTYDSREGQQVSVEIIPSTVPFLGSRSNAANGEREQRPVPGQPKSESNGHDVGAQGADGIDSSEVPF